MIELLIFCFVLVLLLFCIFSKYNLTDSYNGNVKLYFQNRNPGLITSYYDTYNWYPLKVYPYV